MDCSNAILKLLLMVFNLVFFLINFIMTILFAVKVTYPVSQGNMVTSVLAIQLSLVGLTVLFAFGLWVTFKRKFLLLKLFSIVLSIFIAAQVVSASLLFSGQGTDIFAEVIKNVCSGAHSSLGTAKAGAKVGDALWVCCCPASCDIPLGKPTASGITSGDMIRCDMRQQPRATGGCVPSTPRPPPSQGVNNSTNSSSGHPHRLLQAAGSWSDEPTPQPDEDEDAWMQQYKDWKWPLLACQATGESALRIAMENRKITDLSDPSAKKIPGMPRLTAWMSGDPDAKSARIRQKSDVSDEKWTKAEPKAKTGSTCKTQTDCLKMYIHEKENTMEIFAGVLFGILFLETLMTIATWNLGKRATVGHGDFQKSSYTGGRELEENVSAGDALDGYLKETR